MLRLCTTLWGTKPCTVEQNNEEEDVIPPGVTKTTLRRLSLPRFRQAKQKKRWMDESLIHQAGPWNGTRKGKGVWKRSGLSLIGE
jgi:hypothetical protein